MDQATVDSPPSSLSTASRCPAETASSMVGNVDEGLRTSWSCRISDGKLVSVPHTSGSGSGAGISPVPPVDLLLSCCDTFSSLGNESSSSWFGCNGASAGVPRKLGSFEVEYDYWWW